MRMRLATLHGAMRSLSWTTLYSHAELLAPLGAIDINPSKNTAPAQYLEY